MKPAAFSSRQTSHPSQLSTSLLNSLPQPAKSKGYRLLFALAIIATLFISGRASAQGFGTIVGTITDSTGAVIPNANIKVVNEGTKLTREVKANDQGYYVIPSLDPSVYTVTIEAPGFSSYKQNNVTLLADQSLTISAPLTIGGEAQTVSVESNAVQVNTSTSVLNQVVEQKRIVDLPLNGRNAVSLALLVPGATVGSNSGIDQGITKTFPSAITLSFNGSRSNQSSYNLDGVSNNDTYTNVNMPFPFPDALQEFSVQTANYSTRYGGSAGAVINAITKSGNNGFHGDAFEFVRNAVFNARNYFATTRDQLKRNQFGGTIGGPIMIPHLYDGRDKTFFFFGYQQTEVRNIVNGNQAFVPTAAELNGDFSAYLSATNPANPLGKAYQLVNPITKAPYVNNQIPVASFDKSAVALTKYLPLAGADQSGRVLYGLPSKQSFHEYMGRIDHSIGSKDRISARYYLNKFNNGSFLDQTNYLSEVSPTQSYAHNAIVSDTHIFTPNILNDLRLSYTRVTTNTGPPAGSVNYNDLGVNIYQPAGTKFLGQVTVTGYFGTTGTNLPLKIYRDNYNLADDFTVIHGRHSIVFGVAAVRGTVLLRDAFQAAGNFGFTADSTNNALAGFLLGNVRTFVQAAGETKDNRDHPIAVYAQDDFHATRRLTLNMGLRWEPYLPWVETKGRVEQFRPDNYAAGIRSTVFPNAPAGLIFPGDAGMPYNGVNPSWNVFAPRFGFAYDVFGNGKTAIRGAIGSFHDSQQVGIGNNRFVDVTPFSPTVSLTTPAGPFSNPYLGITNPFPASPVPSANTAFTAPVLVVTYNPANNSKLFVPTTYDFNLTVEQQLKGGFLGRISYVGSLARHVYESVELNPAIYTPGSTLGTDARRGYKGFGSIAEVNDDAVSNYNGVQLSIQRRFEHLTVLANYTFSKSLDDIPYLQSNTNASASNNSALPYGTINRHAFDYGSSDFDRRHIGVLSYVYDLPGASLHNALLKEAIGGWQTTGILRLQSGTPFTVIAGSDRSQTGLNSDRATVVPGVPQYSKTGCTIASACVGYLNQAAFAIPALGSAGNLGKNSLFGPGAINWDVGLLKNIPLGSDRFRLQFHAEFFNVINKTNLNNPVASIATAGFGTVTSSTDPRIGQLALKLNF
ncbi:carboxypeptidase-like regulatory domain-containing protein [Granulicella tundricola]|uniref:TonB-dependent receptor plug n=1 Tax=Granulicella tundricola (strain ATCC BAA-1859 / DSM 23138 / MP5ACTX9) TaxID=1198114 RepID=E8X6Z8_GRATM|nr:carboxypeptidase-like regulatory domain-containing protein [Granulicella tundricola]ADW71107.1 TonB-dependent receptor plug [Granulicella tundricola MP5ACTX9]